MLFFFFERFTDVDYMKSKSKRTEKKIEERHYSLTFTIQQNNVGQTKFKTFADDNLNIANMMIFFFGRVENLKSCARRANGRVTDRKSFYPFIFVFMFVCTGMCGDVRFITLFKTLTGQNRQICPFDVG